MLSSDVRWGVCESCRKCLGAAWVAWPGAGPASLGGQAQRKHGGSFVSQSNLDFCTLLLVGLRALGLACLPSQDPSRRGFGGAEVCPGGATQGEGAALPWVGFQDIGPSLWPLKGSNPLDSRIAEEGKHSGYQSFSHCNGPGSVNFIRH